MFTAFVEPDVGEEVENPPDYGPIDWSGPLHCVRFSRDAFQKWLHDAGFEVVELSNREASDWQSRYIVRAVPTSDE